MSPEIEFPIRIGLESIIDRDNRENVKSTFITYYYIKKEDTSETSQSTTPGDQDKITVYSMIDSTGISNDELAEMRKSKLKTINRIFNNNTFNSVCIQAGINPDDISDEAMRYLINHISIRRHLSLSEVGKSEIEAINENIAEEEISNGYTTEDLEIIKSYM